MLVYRYLKIPQLIPYFTICTIFTIKGKDVMKRCYEKKEVVYGYKGDDEGGDEGDECKGARGDIV